MEHATEPKLVFYNPEENGWLLVENKYQIEWFTGPQTPSTLLEEISSSPESDDEECVLYNQSSDEEN